MWDRDGREYIDGSSGAISVISVGHGRQEVVDAMARQTQQVAYVQGGRFRQPVVEELARMFTSFAPGDLTRAIFVSGGSEATETAIKLARAYHLARGNDRKHLVLGRDRSYHGNTLGALAVSGYGTRREPYLPLLKDAPRVAECNCYRCPFGLSYPSCEIACAQDLERAISEAGPENVAAFIAEPIVGAAGAATTPPEGYFDVIRQICDEHDILFIADEVVTGMGRTGKTWGIEHWDVVPDIITTAKGLSGGYAPLAALLVSEHVEDVFRSSALPFVHGFTYQAHPVACAAGLAVLDIIQREELVDNAGVRGVQLRGGLEALKARHPTIGEIRGKGLLQGIEFVADRVTREPFKRDMGFTSKLIDAALHQGLALYPGNSGNGHGDQVLVSPPLIVTSDDIDEIVKRLDAALTDVETAVL